MVSESMNERAQTPRQLTVQRMPVFIHQDQAALAEAASLQVADILRQSVAERGVAYAMFATGNSQLGMIDRMAAEPDVPWQEVVVFHMDEYLGMAADHPASFQRWIREHITDKVRPRVAHYLDGLAEPADECDRYAELLRRMPLDLCCLGIGENGHLAFNDPPAADFHDPVRVKLVDLDLACRTQQVNEGHFPDVTAVPGQALTVTIPALLAASNVLAIVPELRKAAPVRAALEGPVATSCPASVLRLNAHVTMHLDAESASQLSELQPG